MRKILKYTGKMLQALITVLLAFLLACNLYLIVLDRIIGVEHPTILGYSVAVVASGSMEPFLSADDLILNHQQSSYRKGDIITFQSGDSLTTHRIVEISNEGYVTQGDANNTADLEVVSINSVLGRVVWVIPYAGSVLAFLKSPLGIVILISLGFCIIELSFFFQRQRSQTDGEEL